MNVIKKYWESVYRYILILIPGLCMCAGTYWTICKFLGAYPDLSWVQIILFDLSQILYMSVGIYFIYRNKKEPTYISGHLPFVKAFIIILLFIQYNAILYLFPSYYVWECTFIFLAVIAFLFDSRLMAFNIGVYATLLLIAHIANPENYLPINDEALSEIIAYRILMYIITSACIMFVEIFAERFLAQATKSNEENRLLIEKQLKYYQDMELMDTELRKFRHDIKNHFICMEWLFNTGKTDELQKYFQDLEESFSFKQPLTLSGNDIIDAILHHDLPHYCNDKIKVSVHGSLPALHTVSAMDLCTLFSNMLSNAITSASQCEKETALPEVTIRFSGGNSYFSIEMSNSVLHQNFSLKRKITDRNHGHGIQKIKDVIEKYNGHYEIKTESDLITIIVYLPI